MEQDAKFKCNRCGKSYKFKSILLLHLMKCDEISLENNDKEISETETMTNSKQKQKMKDKEYTVIINDDSSKIYQCNICEKKFNTQTYILQHHYNVHKEMKFKCDKCNISFPFKSLLKIHGKCDGTIKKNRKLRQLKNIEYKISKDENSQNIFQCMRCDKKFNYVQGFNQHFYLVHREKSFECEQCNRFFPHKFNLKSHLKVCFGKAGLKNKTEAKENLKNIKYITIEDNISGKMYQCQKCKKSFGNLSLIHQHIYHVHREKTNNCEKCGRLFPFMSRLNSHLKKCNGVEKEKREPNQIVRGVDYKIISNVDLRKIYQCTRCNKKFNNSGLINQHFHHVHMEKKIGCDQCDKFFPFRSRLNQHIKRYHADVSERKLKCEKCSKPFYKKTTLEIHSWNCGKTKEAKCEICDKVFKSPSVVQVHFNLTHKEKTLKCEKCGKTFPFKSYLKSHTEKCDAENQKHEKSEKSKSKEISTNVKAIEFGNIEINIDDDVLQIYG